MTTKTKTRKTSKSRRLTPAEHKDAILRHVARTRMPYSAAPLFLRAAEPVPAPPFHPHTARELFATLRAYFNDLQIADVERKAAWDVLTALRGPDDDSYERKDATTAVIREAVIGIDACRAVGVNVEHDSEHRAGVRRDFAYSQSRGNLVHEHFYHHVEKAFKALGLDWTKSNVK